MYYKFPDATGKVLRVHKGDITGGESITKEEYEALLEVFRARAAKVAFYVKQVKTETINVADVPAEYYDEVHSLLHQSEEAKAVDEDMQSKYETLMANLYGV